MEHEKDLVGGEITEVESAPADSRGRGSWMVSSAFLLFVFAFLAGFILKAEAVRRFTIGFEDYKIDTPQGRYDLNQVRQATDAKQQAAANQNPESAGGVQAQPASDPAAGNEAQPGADATCADPSAASCSAQAQ